MTPSTRRAGTAHHQPVPANVQARADQRLADLIREELEGGP